MSLEGEDEKVIDLEEAGGNTCFLSGLQGELNGGAEEVYIRRNVDGNKWELHLRSTETTADSLLTGFATCIDADSVAWARGGNNLDLDLVSSGGSGDQPNVACALAGVGGHLEGHQDIVEIRPRGEPPANIMPSTFPVTTPWPVPNHFPVDWSVHTEDNIIATDREPRVTAVCFEI